jgi:hypothetical protein
VTSSPGRSHPGLGAFPPPALQTFPQAVTSNVAIARTRTRSRIMAVVKADGYGHGAITVAQAAIAAGAEWLGASDISEASKLRAAGLTVPILTWLNPSGVDAEAAATDQIDIAVGSVGELEALLKHAAVLSDRLYAQQFAETIYSEPAQLVRLGEDRAGMFMPWLEELVALTIDGPAIQRLYRMQALLFAVLDVLIPFIKTTPAKCRRASAPG